MSERRSAAAWAAILAGAIAIGCGGSTGATDSPSDGDAAGQEDAAFGEDAEVVEADGEATEDAEAGEDAEAAVDDGGAETPPLLTLTYADPCPCVPAPCCPQVTLTFEPGSEAAWYLMCGDAVACELPPVGWERQATGGTWERIVSPGESSGAGFQCAPGTWSDLGMYSVPEPPSGTVRAVGLFDGECGADPGSCGTRCAAPHEVTSNAVVIP
ncbi:MAG: hypothetical protein HY907_11875 [Deltaproteobacteria bacterium]|nr:hypothetical protein [Deltaproteobacteria bacterium]